MPEIGQASGIYHGVIEQARYDNGVMWARAWIPAWSTAQLKYITPWALISIPWGTFNYGTWGSPHRGEHVWVAFEQADPERPVIIGYIPMPQVVNEEGKQVIEMPPEFVNDDYTDKTPHTGKRDDPEGDNPPINPAWITATPLFHQYFLLHDKLKRVVARVADVPTMIPPPPPPPPENTDELADAAVAQVGEDAAGPLVAAALETAFAENIEKARDSILDKIVEKGIELIEEATGLDVSAVVKTVGDFVEKAAEVLDNPAEVIGEAIQYAIDTVLGGGE